MLIQKESIKFHEFQIQNVFNSSKQIVAFMYFINMLVLVLNVEISTSKLMYLSVGSGFALFFI